MQSWQISNISRGIEKGISLNRKPIPNPKSNECLVKILAASLNPIDYKLPEGIFRFFLPKHRTPGFDFAGEIVIPASDLEGSYLKKGQLVFGVTASTPMSGDGSLQEFAAVPNGCYAPVPSGISAIDAAGLGVAGLTAYQSMFPAMREGARIFINGGSGGTGVFGIQIAKSAGMQVTTSCSTRNVELVKSLGADDVIDYSKESVLAALKSRSRFDYVIDNVGLDWSLYYKAHQYTVPGAPYIMVAGGWLRHSLEMLLAKTVPTIFGGGRRPLSGMMPSPTTADLSKLITLATDGKLRPVIDSVYEFNDVPAAFEKLKTGRSQGKIVVKIADENSETSE